MPIDESVRRRRLAPIIAPRAIPVPEGRWNDEQWTRLRSGMYPGGMDHRWSTYLVGQRLYLHRSWTGQGIFEAEFTRVAGGWRVVAALAESAQVNSFVDRPDAALSGLLRRVIDIPASWDPAND
jgi:hypothetical protein